MEGRIIIDTTTNKSVKYFAYGANRDVRMMSAILGEPVKNIKGEPAILQGYDLGIQKLQDLPDTISSHAPFAKSPRKIVARNWPDNFESYVIVSNPDGKVAGTIWYLTPEQRERVRDWELLDFGWYHDIAAIAYNSNGQQIEVVGEAVDPNNQSIDRIVDGLEYQTWLQDPKEFERVAAIVRREYDERQEQKRLDELERETDRLNHA